MRKLMCWLKEQECVSVGGQMRSAIPSDLIGIRVPLGASPKWSRPQPLRGRCLCLIPRQQSVSSSLNNSCCSPFNGQHFIQHCLIDFDHPAQSICTTVLEFLHMRIGHLIRRPHTQISQSPPLSLFHLHQHAFSSSPLNKGPRAMDNQSFQSF